MRHQLPGSYQEVTHKTVIPFYRNRRVTVHPCRQPTSRPRRQGGLEGGLAV